MYAGAVGRFDFADDEMDTCIAIRTMTFKQGVAYLQAGGGIVYDSVEEDEYVETINKLQGNVRALSAAESTFLHLHIPDNPANRTYRVLARCSEGASQGCPFVDEIIRSQGILYCNTEDPCQPMLYLCAPLLDSLA